MNDQNFDEQANLSDIVEQTELGANPSVEISDYFEDPVPVAATPAPDETIIHETAAATDAGSTAALFNIEESELFRTRWNEIQGRFVDEPRSAVQQADALVSEVIEKITQMFANEHGSLERQWNQGNEVSTEEFRQALQHYRSFFNRLILKNEE